MEGRCSRLWEIDLYREGRLRRSDAKSFERHLRTCRTCRLQRERDERLRHLVCALPDEEPTELSLRRLRGRVLRDAATGAAPRMASRGLLVRIAAWVAAVGMGMSVWAFVSRRAPPSPGTPASAIPSLATRLTGPGTPEPGQAFAGIVVPSATARWSQTRRQGVEHIVLQDGALRLHVRPQVAGERFLVTLPDGELEVRGTTFDVSVEHEATTQVRVDDGVVDLRLQGQATRRLGAGEAWSAAVPLAGASLSHAERRIPSPPAALLDGGAYAAAIGLLREGRDDEAASAFHTFVLSRPGAQQAEDASFLEALALARAGHIDAAGLAAEHHLARFPRSFHRKEAAILAARAAGQRGECGRAQTLLAPWMGERPNAEVDAAIRACKSP